MRSHIFIDGANLYHAIKYAKAQGGRLEIDYAAIPPLLARLTDTELLRTSFYTGIPEDATHERLDFLDRLETLPDFEVKTKTLVKRGDHLVEKGIDVLIATDMLWNGLKGYVDHVILVSGDGDLTDAVKRLMDNGVRVTVAMFEKHASNTLERTADRFIDLSKHVKELV